ncbi:3-deoxy-7-phosphoheptulonate synthase [Dichelobacter nodosus]|uniref:Phospho-2-dehydro-3-deoxyheptonate aldolase n=1 Tax=Dichelobacter nodosus (strain VCS1703A) TaxID=246195 RepID=A5EXY7_DICNV|nr:3-deoxy-7-phosphoheptulonate synthase [Dichelobacter nodosus]ABQ14147.1 phospho-2-dehydro-3-deoxyheptonate aldolase [Dichelobacter nodosus VCS1703A]AXM45787.1 3-deoxy-7-phosphoheptulonate synthase [Dichelobacter nodosus]KNZ39239.1 phospho-2-dehydro-3-deoxyheptonate aldolase [Dichelobacter nodosus]TGA64451.1 3-deoxy-7-phosphoheptulonate synthase [Dichelobacter nodosus]
MPTASNSHHSFITQTLLPSPESLIHALPANAVAAQTIHQARQTICQILNRHDNRKLFIIGPCSIDDPVAALDYAQRLKQLADEVKDTFFIVMRVYLEKPRTGVGWKGFINDPDLDQSFNIEKGLYLARQLLIDINTLGLPCATEALEPISVPYLNDLISWTAIGARTAESQIHREIASALETPVGFKNSTDGCLDSAIYAMKSAAQPHHFLSINTRGMAVITHSSGNPHTHIVLRGGRLGINYDADSVALCTKLLQQHGLKTNIMIDCSHANSGKDHQRQPIVLKNVIEQICRGNRAIMGLMLESYLQAGNQRLTAGGCSLKLGTSLTDPCLDWETTQSIVLQSRDMLTAHISADSALP